MLAKKQNKCQGVSSVQGQFPVIAALRNVSQRLKVPSLHCIGKAAVQESCALMPSTDSNLSKGHYALAIAKLAGTANYTISGCLYLQVSALWGQRTRHCGLATCCLDTA
jgi:hypothetical protein